MTSKPTIRRSLLIAMIVLVVALSFLSCFDHHICSNQNCLICNLLSPLMQRICLVACQWQVVLRLFEMLIATTALMLLPQRPLTPVGQKIKLSC